MGAGGSLNLTDGGSMKKPDPLSFEELRKQKPVNRDRGFEFSPEDPHELFNEGRTHRPSPENKHDS